MNVSRKFVLKAMITQAHIFYSGTVQGIGFRYTTQRFALELGLRGWVKNLHDGRVEILAEGKKELIEELFVRINKYFEGYVRDSKITYKEAKEDLVGFRIAD